MPRTEKTFGSRLRRAREKRGWSQSELARQAGLSSQAVLHLERGSRQPGLGTAQKLAAALGMPLAELVE